jgi:hypothetical protein
MASASGFESGGPAFKINQVGSFELVHAHRMSLTKLAEGAKSFAGKSAAQRATLRIAFLFQPESRHAMTTLT